MLTDTVDNGNNQKISILHLTRVCGIPLLNNLFLCGTLFNKIKLKTPQSTANDCPLTGISFESQQTSM